MIEFDSEGNVGLSEVERSIGRENYGMSPIHYCVLWKSLIRWTTSLTFCHSCIVVLDFYCFLLWPFVETYWLAAVSLYTLIPTAEELIPPLDSNGEPQLHWVEERVFMEKTQMFGKTLYYQGDLSYFESVNMETLKNGFHRLSDYGILVIKKPTNNKERTKVALHPDFIPSRGPNGRVIAEGTLWEMVERIGTFRREGKNRRDNATGKHVFELTALAYQSYCLFAMYTF